MAHTYEVYLRNRLTEFDIIIQNLPYRDGLIAHTKMYLDAMVNYLYLQKFIIGKHNVSLQTDIDNLLERVFNVFKNNTALQFDAEAVAKKPIRVSSDLILQTPEILVQEEVFNTCSEFMRLTTAALKYDIQKSIGTGKIKMALTTKTANTLKTSLEKFDELFTLDVSAIPSSQKFVAPKTELQLLTDPFNIYYLIAIQCEALLNLSCAMDYEIWFSLGNARSEFCLTTRIGNICEETFCDAAKLLNLLCEVNATLTNFIFPADAALSLVGIVEAGLKRYRKIYEVDPLTISTMDGMSIKELDYVVLA